MYKRYKQDWLKHIDFFLVDEIALQMALIVSSYIRHGYGPYSNSSPMISRQYMLACSTSVDVRYSIFECASGSLVR